MKISEVNKNIFIWWGAWTSLIILLTVPYWFNDSDSYLIWGNNWSYLFISFAGIMKAIMDTLNFHFTSSVFSNLKKDFWSAEFSWQNKYTKEFKRKTFLGIPIPVMFLDSWHLFQSFHINLLMLTIAYCLYNPQISHGFVVDFLAYSFLYRAFFFLFYKYFLVRK